MQLRNLFDNDNRAVSPVIGVILMVAITVILAAVIGTFVLGLGDSMGQNAPTASFDSSEDGAGNVTFTHAGGQDVDFSELSTNAGNMSASDDTLSAGDEVEVEVTGSNLTDDDDVRLIWSSGGSSSTIATHTLTSGWDGS